MNIIVYVLFPVTYIGAWSLNLQWELVFFALNMDFISKNLVIHILLYYITFEYRTFCQDYIIFCNCLYKDLEAQQCSCIMNSQSVSGVCEGLWDMLSKIGCGLLH